MDPLCDWCSDDLRHGAYKVDIYKRDEPQTVLKTLTLCKKCVKQLVEK